MRNNKGKSRSIKSCCFLLGILTLTGCANSETLIVRDYPMNRTPYYTPPPTPKKQQKPQTHNQTHPNKQNHTKNPTTTPQQNN